MAIVLSLINALIFTIISGFHFYWAMGGKVGFDVVLPSNTEGVKSLNPSKLITVIAACVFLSITFFYLIKANLIHLQLPNLIIDYGLYALAIVLIIRAIGDFKYVGFFKTIKNTIANRSTVATSFHKRNLKEECFTTSFCSCLNIT